MSDIPPELVCPLCLDLLHDPISTACSHTYCRACIRRVLATGHGSCPLCRREIRNFDPASAIQDASVMDRIAAAIPEEQVTRRAREAFDRLEFVIGNLYEEVPGRPARSNSTLRNTNKWTMYVTLCGDASQHTSKLIEKIVYSLHPTFKPSSVTAYGPTFSISRLGWGTFPVECEIHWNPSLRVPPTIIDHWLEFEAGGARTSGSVDITPTAAAFITGISNGAAAALRSVRQARPPRQVPAPRRRTGMSPPARANSVSSPRDEAAQTSQLPVPRHRTVSSPPARGYGSARNGAAQASQQDLLEVVVGNRSIARDTTPGSSRQTYRWTMYVMLPRHQRKMSNLIESVVYELHPSFMDNIVTCRSPPFEISRVGWGTFGVKCTIIWKARTRIPTTEIVHQLVFDDPDNSRTATTVGIQGNILQSI